MEREPHTDFVPARPAGVLDTPVARCEDCLHPCEACGQTYDLRDLGLVLHHLERGHAPLPVVSLT
jgi:hypothetical protein